MCMFMFGLLPQGTPAPHKLQVAGTNIFARARDEMQALVYGMNVSAQAPVAMVLPLPVPADSPEDAVRFVDLQAYPTFFVDLNACFPAVLAPQARGGRGGGPGGEVRRTLVVHDAGDFEASFVPTLADVDRLDSRFRVPEALWNNLPQYADWGFAVFQIKNIEPTPATGFRRLFGGGKPKPKTVHPMALEFPRRHRDRLFFPTIHLHDDTLQPHDNYDHLLFWQTGDMQPGLLDPLIHEGFDATLSEGRVGETVDLERAAGLVDAEAPVHRRSLQGLLPNRDHWVIG